MPTLEEYLKEGIKYHQEKKFSEAISAYQQVLCLDLSHTPTYINLFKANLGLKKYNEALSIYLQLIKNVPQITNIHSLILAGLTRTIIVTADEVFLQQVLDMDNSEHLVSILEKLEDMESVKSTLLEKIKALTDIELKQNLLCQALMPDTFIGAIFYFARHLRTPSMERGTLNQISLFLENELNTSNNRVLINSRTLQAFTKQSDKWKRTLNNTAPTLHHVLINHSLVTNKPAPALTTSLITPTTSIEPSAPPMNLINFSSSSSHPPPYNPLFFSSSIQTPAPLKEDSYSDEEPVNRIKELVENLKQQDTDLSDVLDFLVQKQRKLSDSKASQLSRSMPNQDSPLLGIKAETNTAGQKERSNSLSI